MEITIETPAALKENNWVNNLPNPPRTKKYLNPYISIKCGTKDEIIPPLKVLDIYNPIT